ncbi:MAG: Uma2 family endonuclease [bacterium]
MSEVAIKESGVQQPLCFESEEAFEAWCDEDIRAEYLDGEVFMHSPASASHEKSTLWLGRLMGFFIDRYDLGELFGSNIQLRLRHGRRRLADLVFVAKVRLDIVFPTYIEGAADLVVEFVSSESVERDWGDKFLEYAAAGIKEYWIIDKNAQRMALYTLGDGKKYTAIEAIDSKLHSKVLRGFWLRPKWFWQDPLPNAVEIAREIGII